MTATDWTRLDQFLEEVAETRTRTAAACIERGVEAPWKDEADRELFESYGFPCLVQRNMLGSLCGYVGVRKNHRFFAAEIEDLPLQCLKPITYSRKNALPVGAEGMDDVWWIGFHTTYWNDVIPRMHDPFIFDVYHKASVEITYRDFAFVRKECEALAAQCFLFGTHPE